MLSKEICTTNLEKKISKNKTTENNNYSFIHVNNKDGFCKTITYKY